MTENRKRRRQDPYSKPSGCFRQVFRFGLIFVVICATVAAGLLLRGWRQMAQAPGGVVIEGGSPNLGLVERFYLQSYLAANADQLGTVTVGGNEPIQFVIEPGETAADIAQKLTDAGIIQNPQLFRNYVRFYGLDSQLEAGAYALPPNLTLVETAIALTEAKKEEAVVRFVEGWRLEEMADLLRQNPTAQIDPDQFLAIAGRRQAFDLTPYPFLAVLPPAANLEGYLFPDTYILDSEATAADLIGKMLSNFNQRVTPDIRQQIGGQGLDLRQGVTLASIVEREAVVAEERPVIARVFLNRLAQGIKLDADPTIQYGLGRQTDGNWWKSPLWAEDLTFDSPYNTYIYPGLPPSPIANPGLASLQAVGLPANADYLFFVADCNPNAPGSHLFSLTYDEHVTNVEKCN